MTDYFSALIKLQERAVALQCMQIETACRMTEAAGDAIKMQKNMVGAAEAGMKAWDQALALWGVKR